MDKFTKSYTTEEAIQFILDPGSESELSELELSSEEENEEPVMTVPPPRISSDVIVDEMPAVAVADNAESPFGDVSGDEDYVADIAKETKTGKQPKETKKKDADKHIYRRRAKEPPFVDATTFRGQGFSLPPDNIDEYTPLW